jgi:uncharacterized protein YlxW (UPF0749 family)
MSFHRPYGGRPPSASDHTRSSWDLLERVSATALDEDYARASTERPNDPDPDGRRHRPRVLGAVALVGLGLLMAATALQTRSAEPVDDRERAELISQINDQKAEISRLADRSDQIESEVEGLQGTAEQIGSRGEELLDSLDEARLVAGAVPAEGPGLRVVVDDSTSSVSTDGGTVQDIDLQVLVNGLWQAGAEAVAINGNRLGSLSAIRTAGSAITVNYQSLTRPYVVTAIGDPDTVEATFAETPGGQAWFDLETNYGIQFDMETVDDLSLPAVPDERLRTVYATRQGELP